MHAQDLSASIVRIAQRLLEVEAETARSLDNLRNKLLLGLWPEYRGMPKEMQEATLETVIEAACKRLEANRQILERTHDND